MSYSFTVSVASKSDVKAAVAAEMDKVIAMQAIHQRDRDAAINAADAYAQLVTVPEGKTLKVSVSGSVGWSGGAQGSEAEIDLNGAGVSISASVAG